jgi:hypothetical protein
MIPEWPIDARRAAHSDELRPQQQTLATDLDAQRKMIDASLTRSIERATRLRASHDRLLAVLAAARRIRDSGENFLENRGFVDAGAWTELKAAIAAAEESET